MTLTAGGLRRGARWAALPVALGYGLVVWGKWVDGIVGELWWMCHVATLLLAIGLAADRRRLVVIGTLVHLAGGWLIYVVDAALGGETTFTSFVSHIVSPAIGMWAMRRTGPLPDHAALLTWALMIATMVGAWLWVDPALNVNQTQEAWIPGDPRHGAVLWATNVMMLGLAAAGGAWVLARWSAVGAASAPLGESAAP